MNPPVLQRRSFLAAALAAPTVRLLDRGPVGPAAPGAGPYGPLRSEPDENGLLLPEGFTSRVVAVAGEPVGGTDYRWHLFPDGAATFDDGAGGWFYVCNSEVFDLVVPDAGGVSAIHFGPEGEILRAYRILEGSNSNCAGGPTPWGTWLSGEENFAENGRMWECDPKGERAAVVHEALGRWSHEAAAVDPVGEQVYLTQDHPEGLLYRFTPTAYPDLSAGTLEAAIVAADGAVSWGPVADPSGASAPTRQQVPGATIFPGNEGIWYHDGWVYFTSKYDHSVHGIDLENQRYVLIWKGDPDGLGVEGAVLSGVDNITVDVRSGDLIVAEDGANMELVVITPELEVAPLVRVLGHEGSEMTGPCFNPSGDRLYFSSQRAPTPRAIGDIVPGLSPTDFVGGVTYEISGPFRGRVVPEPTTTTTVATTTTSSTTTTTTAPPTTAAPTTTSPVTTLQELATTTTAPAAEDDDDGGGSSAIPLIGGAAAVAAVAAGGVIALRRRRVVPPSGGHGADGGGDDR